MVAGAGQTPGDTIGNGRATAILFAREGARVMVVDRDLGRARDTEAAILADPELSEPQRVALLSIYRSFVPTGRRLTD